MTKNKTMDEWMDEYLFYCKSRQLRPKTLQSYEQGLFLFERWAREKQDITEAGKVTDTVIRHYIVDVQERGKYTVCVNDYAANYNHPERRRDYRAKVSNVTVNGYIRVLRAFFNWLELEGVVSKNPMERIKQLKTDRKAREFLTDEEFTRLCRCMDLSYFSEQRDHMVITLILDTGMRLGECLVLKTEDLDLKNRAILLREDNTKGRKARTVFFSKKAQLLLRKWLRYKDRYCESEFLFPKHDGTVIHLSSFEKNFRMYLNRAGIDKPLTPHCLRNNFAKRCLMNGMDIYTLSRILGHSSVTVTEAAYLDLNDEDIRQRYQHFSPLEAMGRG